MRRVALAGASAGLIALGLPAAPAAADGALGGFSATAMSTPIRIEFYEPLIPIPSEPQAELNVAFTKAIAVSGQARGRSSWLWPGAAVGEGFKTIVEQFGLPSQLGEKGYTFQVNSEYPSDQPSQADEPFPGTVMRTTAGPEETVSKAGFSSTGDLDDSEDQGAAGGGTPGLPSLPGVTSLGQSAAADDPPPGLGALAGVVDANGIDSVSRTRYVGDEVVARGITRIGGLKLLGGIITADSVKVVSKTTSTLGKSDSTSNVVVSGLAIAGVPFGITDEGVVGAGQATPIPGLPDEPAAALDELGVSFTLPTATKSGQGGDGEQRVRGLQVQIDFAKLRNRFDSGPIDALIAQIPDDAGKLKSVLGAPTQARTRMVVVLGDVLTKTSAVSPIDYGTSTDDSTSSGTTLKAGGPTATAGGGGGGVPSSGDLTAALPGESTTVTTDIPAGTVATRPVGAGLPPLGSVPGALSLAGISLASLLGWWLRRMGGLVLGSASTCAHGLASGIPDLRKA